MVYVSPSCPGTNWLPRLSLKLQQSLCLNISDAQSLAVDCYAWHDTLFSALSLFFLFRPKIKSKNNEKKPRGQSTVAQFGYYKQMTTGVMREERSRVIWVAWPATLTMVKSWPMLPLRTVSKLVSCSSRALCWYSSNAMGHLKPCSYPKAIESWPHLSLVEALRRVGLAPCSGTEWVNRGGGHNAWGLVLLVLV